MKKFPHYSIFMLLVFSIYFMACTSSKQATRFANVQFDDVELPSRGKQAIDMEPILLKTADSMYGNYRRKFKGKLERNLISFNNSKPGPGKQSKHVWFSYEEFKAFADALEAAKKEMDKKPDRHVSGVRIYYGAYLPNYNKEIYRKKLTVIFSGTYAKNNDPNTHIDITVLNKRGERELLGYYNHGHLCPPDVCEGALLDKE